MLSFHRKSLYTVITIIGLGYFVAYATIQFVADRLGGTIPFFDYYHVPFIVLFLLSIFLVWTRPRIGYLLSVIVGLVAVAIFTPFTFVKGLSSPADTGYLPSNFTTTAGKTVTWANKDSTTHTVTSTTGLFDSGILNPGQTYSHAFAQAGVYGYYCTLHSWMKG